MSAYDLLRALAILPLPQALRATIWAGMVRSLDKEEFLRELYDVANQFVTLASSTEDEEAWEARITDVVMQAATELKDSLLQHLAEDCQEQPRPLEFLSTWVLKNLQFEDIRTASTHAAPLVKQAGAQVTFEQPAAVLLPTAAATPAPAAIPVVITGPVATDRSREFEEWVLAQQD